MNSILSLGKSDITRVSLEKPAINTIPSIYSTHSLTAIYNIFSWFNCLYLHHKQKTRHIYRNLCDVSQLYSFNTHIEIWKKWIYAVFPCSTYNSFQILPKWTPSYCPDFPFYDSTRRNKPFFAPYKIGALPNANIPYKINRIYLTVCTMSPPCGSYCLPPVRLMWCTVNNNQ